MRRTVRLDEFLELVASLPLCLIGVEPAAARTRFRNSLRPPGWARVRREYRLKPDDPRRQAPRAFSNVDVLLAMSDGADDGLVLTMHEVVNACTRHGGPGEFEPALAESIFACGWQDELELACAT